MPLADLRIDDLVLRVGDLSQEEGRRLATLIRDRLALKVATGAMPTHVGRVDLELELGAALPLPELADRIVARLTERLGLEG